MNIKRVSISNTDVNSVLYERVWLASIKNKKKMLTPIIFLYFSTPSGVATITGTQYPSRVAITMLTDLYTTFSAKHGDAAKTAAENSLSKKAKKVLEDSCKKFADPSSVDKAQQVLGQVDAVKGQMQDNIASMLKNTEKADDMAAKSEQLNEQASVFKKRSTDLKKQMQWKNLKMTIILGAVILVIVLAVVVPLVLKAKRLAGK